MQLPAVHGSYQSWYISAFKDQVSGLNLQRNQRSGPYHWLNL